MKRTAAVIGCGIISISLIGAAPRGAARSMSAGEFLARVASAATGHEIVGAAEAARTLGATLPVGEATPLTQGIAARIASDLGVAVLPASKPQDPLSAVQGDALARSLGTRLADRSGTPPPETDLPNQCLDEANRGACVNCCKTATGLASNVCSHFCQQINPPPSPGEPEP